MNLKRSLLAASCLMLLFIAPLSGEIRFSLKLAGGASRIDPQQVNRTVSSWVERQEKESAFRSQWTFLEGKTPSIGYAFNVDGELMCSFGRHMALSIGSGLTFAELSPEDTEVRIVKQAGETLTVQPRTLSAIPLVLSVYYLLPVSGHFTIFAKAGAGSLWGKYVERENTKRVTDAKYRSNLAVNASANRPLYHIGAGMFLGLDSGLQFFIEGSWRWAVLKGFQGETATGEEGTLYHFEEFDADLQFWQAKNRILTGEPSGPEVRSVEQARVDLSGFTLQLGFMIRF